jgi:hypothetical protein
MSCFLDFRWWVKGVCLEIRKNREVGLSAEKENCPTYSVGRGRLSDMGHKLPPCCEKVISKNIEAGILAYGSWPLTVAAQRWTCTSFHLYALASGPTGRLNGE